MFAKCEFFQPLNSVKDRIGARDDRRLPNETGRSDPTRISSSRRAETRESPWPSCVPPRATV